MKKRTQNKLGPPHSPGVRNLVRDLKTFHSPTNQVEGRKGFTGWHERGYLPHLDRPNTTQFVTYGLADSLPARAWEHLAAATTEEESMRLLMAEFDHHHGECLLRNPELAQMVETAFLHYHGERYELRAWCVMPNHVHVVIHVTKFPLSRILGGWKSYTANEANKMLGCQGKPFWHEDYFDRYARDSEHEKKMIRYVEQNPCKAKFVLDPVQWKWSSARFRDEYGRLCIPEDPTDRGHPGRSGSASETTS